MRLQHQGGLVEGRCGTTSFCWGLNVGISKFYQENGYENRI